jgi:hypothetical protein
VGTDQVKKKKPPRAAESVSLPAAGPSKPTQAPRSLPGMNQLEQTRGLIGHAHPSTQPATVAERPESCATEAKPKSRAVVTFMNLRSHVADGDLAA